MVKMSVRMRQIALRLLIFSHMMVPCRRWYFRYHIILGHCILGREKLRESTARVVDVVPLVLLRCFMSVVT
jgi:hypothetical protein